MAHAARVPGHRATGVRPPLQGPLEAVLADSTARRRPHNPVRPHLAGPVIGERPLLGHVVPVKVAAPRPRLVHGRHGLELRVPFHGRVEVGERGRLRHIVPVEVAHRVPAVGRELGTPPPAPARHKHRDEPRARRRGEHRGQRSSAPHARAGLRADQATSCERAAHAHAPLHRHARMHPAAARRTRALYCMPALTSMALPSLHDRATPRPAGVD